MTTRGYTPPRECPVAGCARAVRPGHLMCPADWRDVPRNLQRAVNDAWRTYRLAKTNTAMDAAWGRYMQARDAALVHVDGLRAP